MRKHYPSHRTLNRVAESRQKKRPDDGSAPDDCWTCGRGVGERCACHQDRRNG